MYQLLYRMFLLLTSFAITPAFAADTYVLDSKHTYVLWHINHFGFSNPSGKWMAEGTLVLDEAKPQNSKLDVLIHVDSLSTGLPELDEHLKAKTFFDVGQFPNAIFVSDKIDVSGKTAKVHGMLTVHGISKPLTLNVRLNKIALSPITEKMTAGFSATAQLKRSAYGMSTFLPNLSDNVNLDIEAEAIKK